MCNSSCLQHESAGVRKRGRRWVLMFQSTDFALKVVGFLRQEGEIAVTGGKLFLTEKGRKRARITVEGR